MCFGCCSTAATNGLRYECGSVDPKGCDVSTVVDGDAATAAVSRDRPAQNDLITGRQSSVAATTTHTLGQDSEGVVANGLNGAGVRHRHIASGGCAAACRAHGDVAADGTCAATTTANALNQQSW